MAAQWKPELIEPGTFALGDDVTEEATGRRGRIVEEITTADWPGAGPVAFVVDFSGSVESCTPAMLAADVGHHRWVRVPDRPAWARGGIVDSGGPVSLRASERVIRAPQCDCGHPDSGHVDTPGVGCTHRPYCLCVHPTGQRVPHVRATI